MQLIDIRTSDGSRHFVRLPKHVSWKALCEHIGLLPGDNFFSNWIAQPRLEFTFRGHRFTVRDSGREFHFYVCDPRCSDVALYQLAYYCEQLLTPNCS
jgi:hypothetical protein